MNEKSLQIRETAKNEMHCICDKMQLNFNVNKTLNQVEAKSITTDDKTVKHHLL